MYSVTSTTSVLARATTLVVLVTEFVLHVGVYQHEAIALGFEGEVLELHRAAVEAHEAACLTEYRGKLVHDTAVATSVVVLSSLAYASELELVDLAFTIDLVECECEYALESC